MPAPTANIEMLQTVVGTILTEHGSLKHYARKLVDKLHGIQPIGQTVLVYLLPMPEKKNDIIIPDAASSVNEPTYRLGLILRLGELKSYMVNHELVVPARPASIQTGSVIMFPGYGNIPVLGSSDYLIVNEANIVAAWPCNTL